MLAARARDVVSRFQQALDHVDRLLTRSDEMFDRTEDTRLSQRDVQDLRDQGNALSSRAERIEDALERRFVELSPADANRVRNGVRGEVWEDRRDWWEAERRFAGKDREEPSHDRSSLFDRLERSARDAAAWNASHGRDDDREYDRYDDWDRGR